MNSMIPQGGWDNDDEQDDEFLRRLNQPQRQRRRPQRQQPQAIIIDQSRSSWVRDAHQTQGSGIFPTAFSTTFGGCLGVLLALIAIPVVIMIGLAMLGAIVAALNGGHHL